MPTGIPWLDEIVENSGLPKMADFEARAADLQSRRLRQRQAHTFRRYAIPYKLVGRTRRYIVDDVVALRASGSKRLLSGFRRSAVLAKSASAALVAQPPAVTTARPAICNREKAETASEKRRKPATG